MGRTPTGQTRTRVLAFVQERLLAGTPPTVREVQQAMGFRSVGTARQHLDALVDTGQLTRADDSQHRGLRLPGRSTGGPGGRPTGGRGSSRPRLVPLLGRVQAGPLTTAVQDIEDHVVVTTRHPPTELFALRVRGDSMAPEILADDVVIVRRQPKAEHGQIVVAMVDDEATIKRLHRRGTGADLRIELHATNPRYAPIVPDPVALVILGLVVELRREFTGA